MTWIIDDAKGIYAQGCDPFDVDQEFVRNAAGEVRYVVKHFDGISCRYEWQHLDEGSNDVLSEGESSGEEWSKWAGEELELVCWEADS